MEIDGSIWGCLLYLDIRLFILHTSFFFEVLRIKPWITYMLGKYCYYY